jgi:exonuclease SbcD
MKIAHSSDWHLGKTLFAHPLIEDQKVALNELKFHLKHEQIDLLLLAGDLFDRSVPPEDAVSLLDSFLTEVVNEQKIPVCMIPGNHDSNTRIGAGANLLRASGLNVFATPDSLSKPFLYQKSGEKVAVFGIPYLEPGEWGAYFKLDPLPRSHEDAMAVVLAHIRPHAEELRAAGYNIILILHAYVSGGTNSESERPLSIGGSEMIRRDLLVGFDYVALGHLHRPQTIVENHIRYSGSLFPYSQSESDQERGFVIIDLQSHDETNRFRFQPFKKTRKLRTIRGAFDSLLASESTRDANQEDDYVIALISDDNVPFEAFRRLNTFVPNLLHLSRNVDWTYEAKESSEHLYRKLQQEISDQEILKTFVEAAASESVSSEDLKWLFIMFEKFLHSTKDSDIESQI